MKILLQIANQNTLNQPNHVLIKANIILSRHSFQSKLFKHNTTFDISD